MKAGLRFFQQILLLSPLVVLANAAIVNAAVPSDAITPNSTPVVETVQPGEVNEVTIAQALPDPTQPMSQSEVSSMPSVSQLSNQSNPADLGQVTSVSQLSDVQPTDWAFQALQSLVERYGVIAGYPDGTYRGNRAMTRYEFAAGLNAALDRVNELIAAGLTDVVTREDLATLQRLQEEFAAELATLRGRVDALESRTAELEANQFSTTTRLVGEVVFGIRGVAAGEDANGNDIPNNVTFGQRTELNLQTSFTGEDLLTARLQARNITPLGDTNGGVLGTNMGRVEFEGANDDNEVRLSLLRYRLPLGENTNIYLAATGNGFVDLDATAQLTPYLDGSAVSLFGLRNPIYSYVGGTGIGLRHQFGESLELNLGYLVSDGDASDPERGLFDGKYGALAQLIWYPSERIRIGFAYLNTYTPSAEGFGTGTGSNLSNEDFGRPVVTNNYGVSGTFDITPNIALSGWVGYAHQRYIGRGDGDVWNWAVGLQFPDLGNEGSIGGLLVGMEPRLTGIDDSVNGGITDEDTSLHLEAFYRYRLSDNIDITPGVIWITAPDHDSDNSDVVIGVLRTRFFF